MQMMGRIIRQTADGSLTIFDERVGECFHSIHGAMQESKHVFIHAGFDWHTSDEVRILEIGFGTGLNAYLTLQRAKELQKKVFYLAVELFPLDHMLVEEFIANSSAIQDKIIFRKMHTVAWNINVEIMPHFTLLKKQSDILTLDFEEMFDIVYFDAFSPERQPELWQENLFATIFRSMSEESVLVTYCAKGEIKRRLRRVGFAVENVPGPPGKREITRAIKKTI